MIKIVGALRWQNFDISRIFPYLEILYWLSECCKIWYWFCDCVIVRLCDCAIVSILILRLCLIVINSFEYYRKGFICYIKAAKFAYWLCDCVKNCILIVWLCKYLYFGYVIARKFAFWLCDCAKKFILIVRLCENLHFDCAIVRLCLIVLDCVDCVWLCGLPWAWFPVKD